MRHALLRLSLLGLFMAGCGLLFDYGERPGGDGGGAAAEACVGDSDCDDGNACTVDRCDGVTCSNHGRADGERCTVNDNDGICEGGRCTISCTADTADVCDDGEPCTADSCDLAASVCSNTPLSNGTSPTSQIVGDCRVVACVDGRSLADPDENDLPIDGDPCTDDVCVDGEPQNPLLPAGTTCGAGDLACDASGVCAGCQSPAECPGVDDFCQQRTCESEACGIVYTAAGTALPSADQTAGPCLEIQCDGTGSTQMVNRPNGEDCDDGVFCNGVDTCLDGACEHPGDPCPNAGDGDPDCSESCDETADDCSNNDAAGAPCTDNTFCNGPDTCDGNGGCTVHEGDPCDGSDFDFDCSEQCREASDDCNGDDPTGDPCQGVNRCCVNGSCVQHSICFQ